MQDRAWRTSTSRRSRSWGCEREAKYGALGPSMRATQHENFATTLSLLRARAVNAIFDDRFAMQPRAATQVIQVRGHDTAAPGASDAGIDLAMHVLARWLTRGQGGPYRNA